MSLGTNLAKDLQAVFDSKPASPRDAAKGLAQAYFDYTKNCIFGPDTAAITPTMRDVMAATLEPALAVPGAPPILAAAFAAAVTAFWFVPPVPCIGPGVGFVNGCPGAAGLAVSLVPVLLNLANTSETAALGTAAALMTATLTCTATLIIGLSSFTFPIT